MSAKTPEIFDAIAAMEKPMRIEKNTCAPLVRLPKHRLKVTGPKAAPRDTHENKTRSKIEVGSTNVKMTAIIATKIIVS